MMAAKDEGGATMSVAASKMNDSRAEPWRSAAGSTDPRSSAAPITQVTTMINVRLCWTTSDFAERLRPTIDHSRVRTGVGCAVVLASCEVMMSRIVRSTAA